VSKRTSSIAIAVTGTSFRKRATHPVTFHPVLQGGRQPAFRFGAVIEARSAVTQVGATTATSVRGPRRQFFADLRTAVTHFHRHQPAYVTVRAGVGNRNSSGFAAGVDLHGHRIDPGLLHLAVDQPNGERIQTCHPGAAPAEQLPRTCRVARHQRFAAAVKHEHPAMRRHG
jgi:hypothetical protein